MKLLRCKLCAGEVDIVGNERSFLKKIKCRKCGYTNDGAPKTTEVFVIRKRIPEE
jgi:hypothetical protein